MNEMEIIMTLGIFKGMQSQTNDPDVNHALGSAIDIFGKLLQGFRLVKPEETPAEEPKNDEPEEVSEGCTDEE